MDIIAVGQSTEPGFVWVFFSNGPPQHVSLGHPLLGTAQGNAMFQQFLANGGTLQLSGQGTLQQMAQGSANAAHAAAQQLNSNLPKGPAPKPVPAMWGISGSPSGPPQAPWALQPVSPPPPPQVPPPFPDAPYLNPSQGALNSAQMQNMWDDWVAQQFGHKPPLPTPGVAPIKPLTPAQQAMMNGLNQMLVEDALGIKPAMPFTPTNIAPPSGPAAGGTTTTLVNPPHSSQPSAIPPKKPWLSGMQAAGIAIGGAQVIHGVSTGDNLQTIGGAINVASVFKPFNFFNNPYFIAASSVLLDPPAIGHGSDVIGAYATPHIGLYIAAGNIFASMTPAQQQVMEEIAIAWGYESLYPYSAAEAMIAFSGMGHAEWLAYIDYWSGQASLPPAPSIPPQPTHPLFNPPPSFYQPPLVPGLGLGGSAGVSQQSGSGGSGGNSTVASRS